MFNKKNDPLVESVKAVMKENEFRRQAEAALNEELGISSKKALPHEYHEAYDRALQNVISEGANVKHADEVMAKSVSSKVRNAMDKFTGNKGGDKPEKKKKDEDPVDAQAKRRHAYMGESNIKHPNQQKLDVHEPEKDELTKKDFEMLRAMGKNKKQIDEKAVSQQQQKFFGLVSAIKKGKAHGSPEAEKVAKEMSAKEVRKFAKTKHEGLPKRVDEESESPTGVQRFTKADARYVALQAGHRDKDTLPKVTDQIRDHINSGESPELRKAFHMNPRDNKIHKKIYDAATKLDEAQGDMTPDEIAATKVSPSLDDRKVKVPQPFTKPANPQQPSGTQTPAPKRPINEVRIKRVAQQLSGELYGGKKPGTEDPDKPVNPTKFRGQLVRAMSAQQKAANKYFKDKPVAESVIDEIRRNLEENLMAIHESGDEELFENYVNSLTEEELDILGLSEQKGLFGLGGFPSTKSTEKPVDSTPVKPAVTTPNVAPNLGMMRPLSPNAPGTSSGVTGQVSRPLPPANPNTDAPVAGVGKTPKADAPSEEPGAQTKPMPVTATPARPAPAPRPATPAARPQPQQRPSKPAMGSHTPFGAYGGSAGPLSLEESVKPQIKESLESFLKNRFLKG